MVSGQSRPPLLVRDTLPPLIPDAVMGVCIVAAWALRRVAPVRRAVYEAPQWGRRLATGASIFAVAGAALVSLHLHGVPPSELATGWFITLTGGHEAGALVSATLFTGVIWWRGTSVGSGSVGDRAAGQRGLVTGTSIAIASAVATSVMPSLLTRVLPIAAVIAVPAVVGALALASLEESQLPRANGPAAATPGRAWIGMVITLSVGTAIVGLLVAFVLSGQARAVVLTLRAIGGAIGALFVIVASIAIIPMLWFAEWLASMMRGRGEPLPDVPLSGIGRQSFLERFDDIETVQVLDPAITEVGIALAALALVGIAVWRLLRPSAPNDLDGAESEERSSVFSWTDVLRRRRPSASRPRTDQTGLNSVRRAYRSFLHALHERGLARTPIETPNQLAMRLRTSLSGADHVDRDLTTLTRAYEAVRYGTGSSERDGEAALAASRRLSGSLPTSRPVSARDPM